MELILFPFQKQMESNKLNHHSKILERLIHPPSGQNEHPFLFNTFNYRKKYGEFENIYSEAKIVNVSLY